MTEDELLKKLRAQRATIQGNGSMIFTPSGVAKDHGIDPMEAQQMLQRLERREDLSVIAQGEMWCLPQDEDRF